MDANNKYEPSSITFMNDRCKCSNPVRDNYIGNGDAYQCKACKGIISGREIRLAAQQAGEQ